MHSLVEAALEYPSVLDCTQIWEQTLAALMLSVIGFSSDFRNRYTFV